MDSLDKRTEIVGTCLLGIPLLGYILAGWPGVLACVGLAIGGALAFFLEDINTWYLIGFGILLAIALFFGTNPVPWVVVVVYVVGGLFLQHRRNGGHGMRLFGGKSEWEKQREFEERLQDKYLAHEKDMAVGAHHADVQITDMTTGSNEEVARINANAQIQAATMQAASAIKVAEYQALGLTKAAKVELVTGREARQLQANLAELDNLTRKEIALDTNQANITISANKLEAETIRIREQMEAELKLLREKQKLTFGETEWETDFEAKRLENEIDAHYKMMDSLDEEARSAFMRRWYGRNRPA